MALTSRPSRRKKSYPGRQIKCGKCGEPLFTDDLPGTPIGTYTCPKCKYHWPPTQEQENFRFGQQREWTDRQAKQTTEAEAKLARGESIFSVPAPTPLSPKQLAERAKAERAEEILSKDKNQLTPAQWKWLRECAAVVGFDVRAEPKQRGNKRGSKKARVTGYGKGRRGEAAYDRARHEIALAEFRGRPKPKMKELARQFPIDGVELNFVVDRIRHAIKSRERRKSLPNPPKS